MAQGGERGLYLQHLNYGLEKKLASAATDNTADNDLLIAAQWFEKNTQVDLIHAGEDRYLAALGYYLSGHYAQAYVLFRGTEPLPDPQLTYGLLRRLFSKDLTGIEADTAAILSLAEYTDNGIANELSSGAITEGEGVERAIIASVNSAFGELIKFIQSGDSAAIDQALGQIDVCYRIATSTCFPETSMYPALLLGAMAILRELRDNSLWTRLHEMCSLDSTGLVRRYIASAARWSPPLIDLWPSQVVAIPKINEGDVGSRPNFLVKMPTSAGKTNVAELSILRFLVDTALQPDKKCIYIAPFHALGVQVETKLQRHFQSLQIGVSDLYGGFEVNPADPLLFNQQRILVTTPEKVDALFRYDRSFASRIGLIFIDEGHLIEDNERGLSVEMLIHRLVLRYANGSARMILASAVLGQVGSLLQSFTGTETPDGLLTSNFRPTRNYLGLLTWDGQKATRELNYVSNETIGGYSPIRPVLRDDRVRALPEAGPQLPLDESLRGRGFPRNNLKNEPLALAALREARAGMTLVYVPRVDWLESLAEAIFVALECIAQCREQRLPVDALELQLPVLTESNRLTLERCIELAVELTGEDSLITRALRTGFVVHYARVPERIRNMLAPLIEQGVFSLVVATSTIIHGVNTPAKTVLVHSTVRPRDGKWTAEISPSELANLIGRAGRAMHETEGVALLFTIANKAGSARSRIHEFVKNLNTVELKSSLHRFLCRVVDAWREQYPGAGVGELCEALASERIDWLHIETRQQLDELDRELLALIQEIPESDTQPATVEYLFDRSLVALQSAIEPEPWYGRQTSLGLLAARVEYLRKIPPAVRQVYYRSGLRLSDCRVLDSCAQALLARLGTLGQLPEYSAEQVSGILWGLYHEFLAELSIFRKMKSLPPACGEQILYGWLTGKRIDAIAGFPAVVDAGLTRFEATEFIDEFCARYLPWALNAVRGYIGSMSPDQITELWISSWATMVHFGLPSPKAAMFYSLGLRSREAAIWCAEECREPAQSGQLVRWLVDLSEDDIQGWQLGSSVTREIVVFRSAMSTLFEMRMLESQRKSNSI